MRIAKIQTGEAAKILSVDRTTIINWIEERGLKRFFSPSAKGKTAALSARSPSQTC